MDNLILLESTKKKITFFGEIAEKCLLMVIESKHPLILHVVRKVLGMVLTQSITLHILTVANKDELLNLLLHCFASTIWNECPCITTK